MESKSKVLSVFKKILRPKISLSFLAIALVATISFFAYDISKDTSAKIKDIMVSNVTGTSATISWVTDSPIPTEVIYSDKNLEENQFKFLVGDSVKKAFDERDIEQNTDGEYVVKESGVKGRYTHIATIRNLEEKSIYEFRLLSKYKALKPTVSSFQTEQIEDVKEPKVAYGEVLNISDDAIAVITATNEFTSRIINISTPINEQGRYSFDFNKLGEEVTDARGLVIKIQDKNKDISSFAFTKESIAPLETIEIIDNVEDVDVSDDGALGSLIGKVNASVVNCNMESDGSTYKVTAQVSRINIRAEASITSKLIGGKNNGEIVKRAGCQGNGDSLWIKTSESQGWIKGSLLTVEEAVHIGQDLNAVESSEIQSIDVQSTDLCEGKQKFEYKVGEANHNIRKMKSATSDSLGTKVSNSVVLACEEDKIEINGYKWIKTSEGYMALTKNLVPIQKNNNLQQTDYLTIQNILQTRGIDSTSNDLISDLYNNDTDSNPSSNTSTIEVTSLPLNNELSIPLISLDTQDSSRDSSFLGSLKCHPGNSCDYLTKNGKNGIDYPMCRENIIVMGTDGLCNNLKGVNIEFGTGDNNLIDDISKTDQEKALQIENTVASKIGGSSLYFGTFFSVNPKIRSKLSSVEEKLAQWHLGGTTYNFPSGIYNFISCGGFAKRVDDCVKRTGLGLECISTHTFGLSVDLNCNQFGNESFKFTNRCVMNIPPEVVEAMESEGFRWGGRFGGDRFDPMHFEYNPFCLNSYSASNPTKIDLINRENNIRIESFERQSKKNLLIKNNLIRPLAAQSNPPLPDTIDFDKLSSGIYNLEVPGYKNASINLFTDNLKLNFFEDTNANGVKDIGELELDITKSNLKLSKVKELKLYNLVEGWNLIALPVIDKNALKVSDIISKAKNSGVTIEQASKYDNGNWIHYVVGKLGDEDKFYGSNFSLIPGQSFFIRTLNQGVFTLSGNVFEENVPIDLDTGWNLVSIQTLEEYTYEKLIKNCRASGIGCKEIYKFQDDKYEGYVYEEGEYYGIDETIDKQKGYFIKVDSGEGIFKP